MSDSHAVILAVACAQGQSAVSLVPGSKHQAPLSPGEDPGLLVPAGPEGPGGGRSGPQPGGGQPPQQGAHRDQPTSPGALGACSTFNGKYCHCQVELGRGPTRSFFFSILRASTGLGREPGVSVLQEMVKPTGKARCGVPAYSLSTGNLKGSSRSANAVRSLAPGFISEAWPRARSRSLTPLRSTENDGVYSTWTQVPPEAFSSLHFGWKALTPSRQGAPTMRILRRAKLSLLREGTAGPQEPLRSVGSCGNVSSRGRPSPTCPGPCCRACAVWARLHTHTLHGAPTAEAPGCPCVEFPNLGSWQ